MKIMKYLFPLFFFPIVCSSFSQEKQIDSLNMHIEYYTLDNGVQVVLQPDSEVDEVAVEFWVLNGSAFEKENQYGLIHFLEHVTPYSKMDSLRYSEFKSFRTSSNAQVRKDYIRYNLEVKPNGLCLALELVAGRLKAGSDSISKKKVEIERKRVLSEIDKNSINPLWSAEGGMILDANIFGSNHPYGHGVYGKKEFSKHFTLEDLQKTYNEIFYAHNVILFIVGNFSIEDVKKNIQYHFKDVSSKTKFPNSFKKAMLSNRNITMKAPHLKDSTNTMVFSWLLPEYSSQDNDELGLFVSILNNRLKERKNSTNSLIENEVSMDLYQFAGAFTITSSFRTAKDSANIKDFVLKKLDHVLTNGITIDELNEAKQNEIAITKEKQKYLGFQYSRTELLGEGLLFSGNPDFYFTRLNRQLELRTDQINITIEKWLRSKPLSVLFVSNKIE